MISSASSTWPAPISVSASRTRDRYRPSIRSLARYDGTARVRRVPSKPTARAASKEVSHTGSDTCTRRMPAHSSHSRCASFTRGPASCSRDVHSDVHTCGKRSTGAHPAPSPAWNVRPLRSSGTRGQRWGSNRLPAAVSGSGTVAPRCAASARVCGNLCLPRSEGGVWSTTCTVRCGNDGHGRRQVARSPAHPLALPEHHGVPGSGASWCTPRDRSRRAAPSPIGGPRNPQVVRCGPSGLQTRRQCSEAHVPAQQPPAREASRLPAPDVRSCRPGGGPGAPPQGPQAPLGLAPGSTRVTAAVRSDGLASPRLQLWRITDRATFHALRSGRRVRRGPALVDLRPAAHRAPARRRPGWPSPSARPPVGPSCATASVAACAPHCGSCRSGARSRRAPTSSVAALIWRTMPWSALVSELDVAVAAVTEAARMTPVARGLHLLVRGYRRSGRRARLTLSLRSKLLDLCPRGARAPRRCPRLVAHHPAPGPLSPLGWHGLGSGP